MNHRVEALSWWRKLTPEERVKKINDWKVNTKFADWSHILIESSSSMIETIWRDEHKVKN
jgi:hypothetical protein